MESETNEKEYGDTSPFIKTDKRGDNNKLIYIMIIIVVIIIVWLLYRRYYVSPFLQPVIRDDIGANTIEDDYIERQVEWLKRLQEKNIASI